MLVLCAVKNIYMLNKIVNLDRNLLILVIGKRGVGKSTDTYEFLLRHQKSLIFDVSMEYQTHNIEGSFFYKKQTPEEICIDEINNFLGIRRILPIQEGRKLNIDETQNLSKEILINYKDGFCLFEDFNKYSTRNKTTDFINIIKSETKNSKIIIHLNSINAAKEIIDEANYVLLYHTVDRFNSYNLSPKTSKVLRKAESLLHEKSYKNVLISIDDRDVVAH